MSLRKVSQFSEKALLGKIVLQLGHLSSLWNFTNVRWQLYCGHTAQDRDTRPPQHRILHKRQGWDASPLMWSYMRTAQEAVKDSSSFCWNFHKCSLYLLATFDKESSPAAFNTSFATAEKFNSLLASVLKTGENCNWNAISASISVLQEMLNGISPNRRGNGFDLERLDYFVLSVCAF